MEIILNEEALARVLDEITLEKLKEAEEIKSEYEAKKIKIELKEKKQEIKEIIKDCSSIHYYFDDFAKDTRHKEKTSYVFICEFRDYTEVYKTYIDLVKEFGFDLVDEIIQERIDLEIGYLKEEEEEKE